jgi:acetyl-CoA carboxylase biotin carboxyl carrier protein
METHAADDQPGLLRLVGDLLAQLQGSSVTECEFRTGDRHIVLRRVLSAGESMAPAITAEVEAVPAAWVPLASPLTGIFYLTETPQSSPFVTVGATVSERQVVGLIESMKMYNPVETEVSGVVRAILVQPSAVVERGQILMYVEPTGEPA